MVQLAIRCHPRVPGSVHELEGWLERQAEELRADFPQGILRLARLTQDREVDLELADAVRDLRLLGLKPTLLAPRAATANGSAA